MKIKKHLQNKDNSNNNLIIIINISRINKEEFKEIENINSIEIPLQTRMKKWWKT